ncbi:MFS general substrate transporter [Flagelloscypha sp. PMI_526]|nr:MFS general substrate transporter [Flagelloscypha sp. PMI_526]
MTNTAAELKALERRVLLKLDLYVLPCLAFYPTNPVPDGTSGNARIAGLEKDLRLHGTQFNTCLAIFYVSYLIVEVPSNWLVKKFKPNRWLPGLVMLWGFVTICTGFVKNFSGLLAIRWFLGLLEGGLLPGMVLYLSTLYKRHELQLRVGIFYASASLSGAFGGLLATGIIKLAGKGVGDYTAGWRWIFFIEGLITMVVAFISMLVLPADLETAKFFTEEERAFAVQRFRDDQLSASRAPVASPTGTSQDTEKASISQNEDTEKVDKVATITYEEEKFEWREVRRGIFEIQVWLTAFAYFGLIVSLYSYSLFLPTIISGLGYKGARAQLFTVPPYAPAAVLTIIVAVFADRLKWRGPFILIFIPIAIIGYIIAITTESNKVRYGSFFLIAGGIYPCGPCILSILPNNSAGHYKKATTTALQLALANMGGFVATFAYTSDQAPKYIRGHSITLGFLCLTEFLMACNVLYCIWENKARAAGRREGNVKKYQELWDAGLTRAPIGDRSPDFRFTL